MAAEQRDLETVKERVTEIFFDFCKKHGETPFSVAADYYGSLIWQLLWNDDLKRSLRVSATRDSNDESAIDIGIDIGAGDDLEFRTEQIADWIMRAGMLKYRSLEPLDKSGVVEFGTGAPPFADAIEKVAFVRVLVTYLETAYKRVNAITPDEFNQAYPLPHK